MTNTEVVLLITTFIFGGTNVWTIILYIIERKKRKLDLTSQQQAIDDKEFDTLKNQLDYQDERIKNYEAKMKERDALDDELRAAMLDLKRGKYDADITALRLSRKLKEKELDYERDACLNYNCTQRIKVQEK
jgi:hypothetical protein